MSTLNVTDINLSGRVNGFRGADIASAATVNLTAATGDLIHISGTTTITSLGTAPQAGVGRRVIFDGALTLTHSANLLLPGNANISVQAGDTAVFVSESTTVWKCVAFLRAAELSTNSGLFLNKQVLTSGTTYTPTPGTKTALVQLWGAGGAGGSTAVGAGSAGAGGGSGSYAEYILNNISGTYSYSIGVGGAPVAAPGVGGTGGNTTFTDGLTTVTANGGFGGGAVSASGVSRISISGLGGSISTNGLVNGEGASGSFGIISTVVTMGAAGNGGATSLGGGGRGFGFISAVSGAGGTPAPNTGAGGGGGGNGTNIIALGGSGSDGVIIITEYR